MKDASRPTFLQNILRTKPLHVIEAEENSQDLRRSLSLFDLLCIGIGSTVGSGIYATTGNIIHETAGPAAVISWIVGGLVCCINALAYMELTTRVPSSGSTYAYAYHAIGELPAVIAAWLLTLEYGVAGAGVARSWADKVYEWILADYPNATVGWLNLDYTNILAFVCQALCVVVLLMGVQFGKAFVNTVTVAKVGIVIFIIIAGFAAMSSDNLTPFIPERDYSYSPPRYGVQGVITGASQAFFGYIGFDEVCCLAAEAKNPKKVMPIAVIGVVLGTMALSVFASLVLSGMVPYTVDKMDFPAAFRHVHWPVAASIVYIGIVVTMPVVVLISFLAQPRLNYALACDGLMPKLFAKVDEEGNLKMNTLVTGVLFTLMAFFIPFTTLWELVSFGILLSFIMSNVALMMVRTRDHSPKLAPRLIGGIVTFSCLFAFLYQVGYTNNGSKGCWVAAMVCLVGTVACCGLLWVKCPQATMDPANFKAPLVPLVPTVSILANWYLISQIQLLGMLCGVAWVAAAVVSYFVYGYKRSEGRTGWRRLLTLLPEDRLTAPMLSVNDVRPSLSSMMKNDK